MQDKKRKPSRVQRSNSWEAWTGRRLLVITAKTIDFIIISADCFRGVGSEVGVFLRRQPGISVSVQLALNLRIVKAIDQVQQCSQRECDSEVDLAGTP